MGVGWGRAVINIKPLLHPIQDVRREINVKEGRFVGCLDPKAIGNLSIILRKNVNATTEQRPVGFNPHEVLIIGNKHRQKHDPVRGQVVYLRIVVSEEILDKLVYGHLNLL